MRPISTGNNRFDAVVVGGGPAGSSAARVLAANGMNVCVVDKSIFPRDKLCGGLLTLRSKKVFNDIFANDWGSTIEAVATGISFYYQSRCLNVIHDYTELYFTCRREFDAFLLRLAAEQGAKLLQGSPVTHVNVAECTLRLADGTTLAGNYVIGADGVNSVVARSLFGESFDRRRTAFALEMEIPVSGIRSPAQVPEIHFGVVPWGYGWVFPKKSTLTAGIGGLHKKNPHLRPRFEEFLRHRFGILPPGKIMGHYIPFGGCRQIPGQGNVLLCGDAAGLVEPITGEGIAFAMLSGKYAAQAVLGAAKHRCPQLALDFYLTEYSRITNAFACSNALRFFLLPKSAQGLLLKLLLRTQSIPRKFLDLLADKLGHAEYTRFLLGKVLCGLLRPVLPIPLGDDRRSG
ncbi:MAG: geranylgeranyl reductase family protein [Verrucomicrobia bacterium]|nr:geranylgeranyl reductase family protein [Verrucomicrobiota bacterium]